MEGKYWLVFVSKYNNCLHGVGEMPFRTEILFQSSKALVLKSTAYKIDH